MRNYNTGIALNDFLFIMLLGFFSLLFLAFLLINPIAKEGKIDPKTEMMILVEWPDKSIVDIDVWIKGPEGTVVSYQRKDGKYIILERDDLGANSDEMLVDGKIQKIERNIETVSINKLIPGEYIINIHNYSYEYSSMLHMDIITKNTEEYPTPVTVKIFKIDPFDIVDQRTVTVSFREEKTVMSFVVNEFGAVVDKRTDLSVPLFNPFGTQPFNSSGAR